MELPGLRWVVVLHPETRRPVNVFVLAGPSTAVVYSHRTRTWRADPALVARTSADDRVEGTDRLLSSDRAGAEEAATEFVTTLPDDAELRRLMAG